MPSLKRPYCGHLLQKHLEIEQAPPVVEVETDEDEVEPPVEAPEEEPANVESENERTDEEDDPARTVSTNCSSDGNYCLQGQGALVAVRVLQFHRQHLCHRRHQLVCRLRFAHHFSGGLSRQMCRHSAISRFNKLQM